MLSKTTTCLGLATILAACAGGEGDEGGGGDDTGAPVGDIPGVPADFAPACSVEGVTCRDVDGQDVGFLGGTILEDVRLGADAGWVLRGGVFIGDGDTEVVLRIDPGTTIFGDGATDGFLVIERNARIDAQGTSTDPIVFTSGLPEGERGRSDWGGLIVNGLAPTNVCQDDGDCPVPGEAGTGLYGGDDPDDSSGVLSHVRVEFAGTLVNDRQEINGIALQGVGRGTTIDHLHAHLVADDGIEFFGGTVDATHLIVTGAGDDGIDWTDGYTGRIQWAFVQHHADLGDNGIEADNNKDAFDLQPRSAPSIQNATFVKAREEGQFAVGAGLLLRAGTAAEISKVVVLNYPNACADIDDPETWAVAYDLEDDVLTGALEVKHSWFQCQDTVLGEPFPTDDFDFLRTDEGPVYDAITADGFFRTRNPGNQVGKDPKLPAPYDTVSPGVVPEAGSPLLGVTAPDLDDDFFEPTDYIGAFGSEDWASWTSFPPN